MIESLKKNKKGILLMLFSSVCVCIGQLFWKLSTTIGMWIVILGFIFYAVGALFMLVAYRYGKLSVLQPILSLNYVVTIFLATFVLKEEVSIIKVMGILVIIIGVILIGGGDEE